MAAYLVPDARHILFETRTRFALNLLVQFSAYRIAELVHGTPKLCVFELALCQSLLHSSVDFLLLGTIDGFLQPLIALVRELNELGEERFAGLNLAIFSLQYKPACISLERDELIVLPF